LDTYLLGIIALMKPKHAFGVAVRIIGLITIMVGIYYLIDDCILALAVGLGGSYMSWRFFVVAAVLILVGLYFLRGAPHIIRFAYRDDDQDSDK